MKFAEYKVRVLEERLRLARTEKYVPGSEKLSDAISRAGLSNNWAENAIRPIALGRSYEQSGVGKVAHPEHIFAEGLRNRYELLKAADSKA